MPEMIRIFGEWKEGDIVTRYSLQARVVAVEAGTADEFLEENRVPVIYKKFEDAGLKKCFWPLASELKRYVSPHHN